MDMNQSVARSNIHVLLVEESIAALTGLRHLIEPTGVQIKAAPNYQAALDLVQSYPFDLIITNLILPEHSGNELALMIRHVENEQGRTPATLIGVTGQALEKVTEDALNAGMNKVYKKPLSFDKVTLWIDGLVRTPFPHEPSSESKHGVLGLDLPDTEAELFEISQYPILDIKVGIEVFQNETATREVLQCILEKPFSDDVQHMNEAHDRGDWKTVEKLAHKIKSGTCYGTVRMYYATLYMERYLKAGHSYCQEELYTQMLHVIHESLLHLKEWFQK